MKRWKRNKLLHPFEQRSGKRRIFVNSLISPATSCSQRLVKGYVNFSSKTDFMARRHKLSAAEFTQLFEKILDKHLGRVDLSQVEKNASAFFGFREHDPFPVDDADSSSSNNSVSLKKAMVEEPKIFDYLTGIFKRDIPKNKWTPGLNARHFFNGQNLYNKYKEVFKERVKECTLQEPYASVYAMYAGYDSLAAFQKVSLQTERTVQPSRMTDYRAFFYSYMKHDIREFRLQIDWSKEPFEVRQKGFHDFNQEPEYVGSATLVQDKMHALVKDEVSGDQMKLVISSGFEPEEREAMLCAVQAVSSYKDRNPMSCETMLVRADHPLTPAVVLRIKRFLFLHRYNFKIKGDEVTLDLLEAKRRDVDMIDYVAGYYYRTWRFDENYNLVQAVMHINDYYRVTCYTSHYHRDILNEQVCMIEVNVSDALRSQTLCISNHPKKGAMIISYMMLNLPERGNSDVFSGIICLTGQGHPAVRSIAMMKDEQLDADFDRGILKSFPFEQAEHEVNKDLRLRPLFEKLLEEEQRNTKPEHIRQYFNRQAASI